ncbi:hypothetical protein [Tessaracoccus antarcticus]|uniref:Uncharacterized protein n=1 Tax=Tessaracoccus antarcticus TaxID=2479848 RepID=A0A3M0GIS4_9ACTN|nr:hypothetical protein [Tessaracoccus antarcticus]RMB61513.1 hypothetical protein EAX62_02400 [Tessaracoccus antarcticus]
MYEWLRRLEPLAPFGDLQRGFATEVADPLWMLGRQWQLGEHVGEDAGTPVGVTVPVARAPLQPVDGLDPTVVPAEAIIEGSALDWWTVGRRVRVGRQVAPDLTAVDLGRAAFSGALPDPYGSSFAGQVDGLAAWRLGLVAADHPAVAGFDPARTDRWSSRTLDHTATFAVGDTEVTVPAHGGGEVDWWSGDSVSELPGPEPAPTPPREVIPTRLAFPGAPLPRIWQIEDRASDIGGYPPDRSHLATVLLIQLIADHATDWFLVPVPAPADGAPGIGVVATLGAVTVRNSFDQNDALTPPPVDAGPVIPDEPVGPWSLYRTSGLGRSSLVLWPTAASPVVGPVLDDVLLGVDEDADVIWAVELRADGVQLAADADTATAMAEGRRTGTRQFTWLPSTTLPEHWHPYRLPTDHALPRVFEQGLVAELNDVVPGIRRGPRSELIGGVSDAEVAEGASPDGRGHVLEPHAVPYQGVRLERRYVLARGTDGLPVLWRQRRRMPLLAGPTSHLRFDVFRESPPG